MISWFQSLPPWRRWLYPIPLVFAYYMIVGYKAADGGRHLLNEVLFLVEKSRLGLYGTPPRLENMGLVYPPLTFLFSIPFTSLHHFYGPLIVSSLAGAVTVSTTAWMLWRTPGTPWLKCCLLALYLFHPVALLCFSSGSGTSFFPPLLTMILYLLTRFYQERRVFYDLHRRAFETNHPILVSERYSRWRLHYIWGAALFACLLFFIRYDLIWFLIFLAPVLLLFCSRSEKSNPLQWISILLLFYFPSLAIAGMWMYLNWVFSNDPLHFLHSPYALFVGTQVREAYSPKLLDIRETYLTTLLHLARQAFLLSPTSLLFLIKTPGTALRWILICPLLGSAFSVYTGLNTLPLESYCWILPVTIVGYCTIGLEVPLKRKWEWAIGVLILILIPLSWQWSPRLSNRDEKAFFQSLKGKDFHSQHQDEMDVARYLKEDLQEKDHILLDDAYGYPIVVYFGDPAPFILPYSNSFRTTLHDPASRVRYIVIPDPLKSEGSYNTISLQLHPMRLQTDFALVKSIGIWRIYRRMKADHPISL